MRSIFRKSLFVALIGFSSACTHLAGVSLSDVEGAGGKKIREDASSTQFLFFGYDGDLPHKAMKKLRDACKGGISGVSTSHEVSWYIFVVVNRVTAEGYCAKG